MNELKHLHVRLSGMQLIEASAGTGKTYAIALLYLRMLVELNCTPQQILVVTFTDAATKELRGRIRRRIREALDHLDGKCDADDLLRDLCCNANGKWGDRKAVRRSLEQALAAFDTAAIFTIHSFCLRALQDNAFESGSRYDTGLVTDPSVVLQEVVDDFWRRSFFGDAAPLLGAVLRNGNSADSLMDFVRKMTGNPLVKMIPECTPDQVAGVDADCLRLFLLIQQEWRERRDELAALVRVDRGLKRDVESYRSDLLPGLFAQMDGFTAADNPFELPPDFRKYTASGIAKRTKPTGTAPVDPFFDLCEELQQMVLRRLSLFRGELLRFCHEQVPLRKQQLNIRFFSDLLNDLYRALCGENGPTLAASLRQNYPAALIDEFQDTDPVQYAIFRMIYDCSALPLFLIGDPKQAIYSFRGADIFAYIQAAGDIDEDDRHTLTTNWRSTPELLAAFNRIFTSRDRPFIYDEIAYHPVVAGRAVNAGLSDPAGNHFPLRILLLPSGFKVTQAAGFVPLAVAAEVSRLLREGAAGRACIDGQPVVPHDIAVIVRSHRQAAAIRDALTPLGIPCVMRSDMTVFETDEAREVCTLLQGVLNPGNEAKVRAALVTDMLGRSGSDIAAFLDDEQGWEACLERFRAYHQVWHDRGFMAMARLVMGQEGVRGQLLRYPDGERRLTNVLHCFEILHGRAHESGCGMEELAVWFSERVSAGEKREEYELRLETDDKAVRILTIHVSKGLEYPIVFCPDLWTGLVLNSEVVSFHEGNVMVADFGSDDFKRNRGLAEKEQLAESLRLLYVALTRARYRCYLYGGRVTSGSASSRPGTSPLACLFHSSPDAPSMADPVRRIMDEYAALSDDAVLNQLQALSAGSDDSISVEQLPDRFSPEKLSLQSVSEQAFSCRQFSGNIPNDWRVASFTSFAAQKRQRDELPDRDERMHPDELPESDRDGVPGGMNIFTFPRGARAGIFMHSIFEELDFASASESAIEAVVEKQLKRHRYDSAWRPCVCAMAAAVMRTPLSDGDRIFTLSDLKKGSWLSELEFFFPLKYVTSEGLRQSVQGFAGENPVDLKTVLSSLRFQPVRGMVRGFMDMVFEHDGRYYLIDWKSNHLGDRMEDYDGEGVCREMVRNYYPLQYLLYTVALNRYLSARVAGYDYERHFGGVFYLFLRGMGQGDSGVFRARPPAGLVRSLTELLIGTVEEACHDSGD